MNKNGCDQKILRQMKEAMETGSKHLDLSFPQLRKISLEYIDTVNKVCLLMLKGLNLKTKEEMLNHRIKNPIGYFDLGEKNKYQFHGRGCAFSNSELSINWDLGYSEKWCGLNPWLLADYIQNNDKYFSGFYTGDKIKDEFEKAVLKGKMIKKYELYYYT